MEELRLSRYELISAVKTNAPACTYTLKIQLKLDFTRAVRYTRLKLPQTDRNNDVLDENGINCTTAERSSREQGGPSLVHICARLVSTLSRFGALLSRPDETSVLRWFRSQCSSRINKYLYLLFMIIFQYNFT